MYLSKKTYVKNWAHQSPERRHVITIEGPQAHHIQPERISYIVEEVAYWRKANAIHAWFVKHAQGGKDDQGDYYVSHETLEALLKDVEHVLDASKLMPGQVSVGARAVAGGDWETIYEDGKVIEDLSVAAEVLPCTPGFFFGSTNYDQFYVKDLEYTRAVLIRLLAEDNDSTFEYHADW